MLTRGELGKLMEEQDVVLSLLSEKTTMLHIVNKSPLERNSLDACLRMASTAAPSC